MRRLILSSEVHVIIGLRSRVKRTLTGVPTLANCRTHCFSFTLARHHAGSRQMLCIGHGRGKMSDVLLEQWPSGASCALPHILKLMQVPTWVSAILLSCSCNALYKSSLIWCPIDRNRSQPRRSFSCGSLGTLHPIQDEAYSLDPRSGESRAKRISPHRATTYAGIDSCSCADLKFL